MPSKCGYSDSVRLLLSYIFGHHNLTSDIEPSELLMVERKTITNIYEANERVINGSQWSEDFKNKAVHVNSLFETLFGDKCLPESVQGEPKFKVYDAVRLTTFSNEVGIIREIEEHEGVYYYHVECYEPCRRVLVVESKLEPYTEPKKGNNTEKQGNSEKIPNQTKDNMEENVNKTYYKSEDWLNGFESPSTGSIVCYDGWRGLLRFPL